MRNRAGVLPFCLVLCASAAAQQQRAPVVTGPWKATFADSLASGNLEFSLSMQADGTVSGTYKASTGGWGTVTGTLQGQTLRFILTQSAGACPGSYTGTLTLEDDRGSGTYWGNDCQGKHENGVISMTRGAPGSAIVSSVGSPGQRSHVCSWVQETPNVFREAGSGEVVDHLGPQEEVVALGRIGTTDTNKLGTWVKVRSERNIVGYAKGGEICDGPASVSSSVSPSESGSSVAAPPNPAATDYPLRLEILHTEQTPYSVQVGGGQINTNCTFIGSYPNLSMSCTSSQMPPVGWRHVLNAMLAVASDGNAYIIACDAAWRWSKCVGLRTGDVFEAHWTKGGLAISYTTLDKKRKQTEATYAVLASKSLR